MAWVTKQTSLAKRTGYFYEGREIALTKYQGDGAKLPRHNGNWWPEQKRIEAATIYAVTKSWEAVRDLVGMPIHAAKKFSEEPWWDAIVSKVKKEKNEQLDAKITEVLSIGLDVVQDRLENGDYIMDRKTKELHRIPVRMKDAAYTSDVLFDKRQLIRGEATTNTGNMTSDQKLVALKDQFEKLAVSKGINPKSEIIEGEAHESSTGETEGQTPKQRESEVRGSPGEQEAGWIYGSEEGQVNEEGSLESETKDTSQETAIQSEVVTAFTA